MSKHNPGDLVLYQHHALHPELVCLVVDVRRDVLGGSSVWGLDGSANVSHTPKRDQLLLVCTTGEPWTSWCDEEVVKPL